MAVAPTFLGLVPHDSPTVYSADALPAGGPEWSAGLLPPEDSERFCRGILPAVSRTFALSIPLLPPPLDNAVTVAYLLCRVADTLEDEATGNAACRGTLLTDFGTLCTLPDGWPARAQKFSRETGTLLRPEAPGPEVQLLNELTTVLSSLAAMPRAVRTHVAECTTAMTHGMSEMLRRAEAHGPAQGLRDLDETFEYCYYVAGTVGEMLTALFAWHSPAVTAVRRDLSARAVAFGRALQLTNILKDARADLDHGRCWLPRSVLAEHGIVDPAQLRDPSYRTQAVKALDLLVGLACREVDRALEYVLTVPSTEVGIRRFCVGPLLLAVLTLRRLHGNPAVFDAAPVKVGRQTVRAAVLTTHATATRNAALLPLFTALIRSLPPPAPEPVTLVSRSAAQNRTPDEAITAALNVLATSQSRTGSWQGDYGGPLFLLPMYVGTYYALGLRPTAATCEGFVRYLLTHQNPDGGWGIDVETDSHVFTSVLNYVALRLLGLPAHDRRLTRARTWFLRHGGAVTAASWGKLFLAVLGLYEYEGLMPLPPELWLLPTALPIHPSRLWCHARMAYLPMTWLYGRRATVASDPLLISLRSELYACPYDRVDWRQARGRVAASDAYRPHHWLLCAAHAAACVYERHPRSALREHALARLLDHIRYEDEATHYLCIGPINKLLNTLVWNFARPGGAEVHAHVEKLSEYLWHAADGTRVQGYNSSELWDTAFAVQAVSATGRARAYRHTLARAADFIERNQVIEDPPDLERYYRHRCRGGWPFSTRLHGWPISDCTAEGLKAVLSLDALNLGFPVTAERREAAVELLLSWQNRDGGWATYENTRGPLWLELLNPSQSFGDIMVDRSYVECTSACIQALRGYEKQRPASVSLSYRNAIDRGERFLLRAQRPDGSWEGSWGVCFTYGTWFGVWGLADSHNPRARAAIDRACNFLTAHQLEDGGWGETAEGCRRRRYVHAESGQAVMTSWALLTLARAGRGDSPAARRAVAFLLRRQQPNGRWPAEHLAGVFNKTCAIHYDAYLRIFPLWALALCFPLNSPSVPDVSK